MENNQQFVKEILQGFAQLIPTMHSPLVLRFKTSYIKIHCPHEECKIHTQRNPPVTMSPFSAAV